MARFAATAEVLAVERERKRMGKQLQETLGRSLAALNDQLDTVTVALGGLPEAAADKLHKAQHQVRSDLRATEQAIVDLQANPLSEHGLVGAIRLRADALAQLAGITVEVQTAELPIGYDVGPGIGALSRRGSGAQACGPPSTCTARGPASSLRSRDSWR